VERAHLLQEVRGQRRRPTGMDVVDLASRMRPTSRLDHPSRGIHLVVPGKRVGLQYAAEVLQMRLWMDALAVRRVAEPCSGCCRAAMRAVVTHIGPQPSLLRLALARH